MKSNPEHIKELCNELSELGITIKPATMELILRMQEQDFKCITEDIDPIVEYRHFLSEDSNK